MIQRVFERAKLAKTPSQVIVATDDERILRAVEAFGGEARITRSDHRTGTERVAEVAAHVLAGRIAEARGNTSEAIADYTKAVAQEDTLDYDEPTDWFYPTRETLAAALLRAHRPADAAKVLRTDLTRNPHNPRSLFALAAALRAQKKDTASVTSAFRRMWEGGTLSLAAY